MGIGSLLRIEFRRKQLEGQGFRTIDVPQHLLRADEYIVCMSDGKRNVRVLPHGLEEMQPDSFRPSRERHFSWQLA